MDAFGYLSVLLSIIVGLGMTQLLAAGGRLIRHRSVVRFYWPPILWAALIVVIFVQLWWTMFGLRAVREWGFVDFLVVLLQSVTLYMMAAVALPEEVGDEGVDLREHYQAHQSWMFGFLLATIAVSALKELTLAGRLPEGENLAFHVFFAAVCVSGMVIRRQRYHEFLAILSAVAMGAYIAMLFARLR
jgi:hypothetical protein